MDPDRDRILGGVKVFRDLWDGPIVSEARAQQLSVGGGKIVQDPLNRAASQEPAFGTLIHWDSERVLLKELRASAFASPAVDRQPFEITKAIAEPILDRLIRWPEKKEHVQVLDQVLGIRWGEAEA